MFFRVLRSLWVKESSFEDEISLPNNSKLQSLIIILWTFHSSMITFLNFLSSLWHQQYLALIAVIILCNTNATRAIFLFFDTNFTAQKSVRIQRFSGPNSKKYGPEKLRIRTFFMQSFFASFWELYQSFFILARHNVHVLCKEGY